MKKGVRLGFLLVTTAVFFFLDSLGHGAELEFLPESHHQRYQTYGLFIDNQTSLIYRDGGRAWAAVAATVALLGRKTPESSSQLVASASVNTAFRIDDGLNPETADARVDLTWDTSLAGDWLISAGYNHTSGHISDGVLAEDQSLSPLDVGIDSLPVRVIYNGNEFLRPGITLKVLIFPSDPRSKLVSGNEFFEFYPWGHTKDTTRGTPYLAIGFEEYGHDRIELSFHGQLGAYFGNHRDSKRASSLRAVLGVYTGQDPRLKFYYGRNNRVTFGYLGLMMDL
jgi:hypothetical protein